MIQIHMYDNSVIGFPKFPCNSYSTDSVDKVVETIKSLLTNHKSGVSKILIENDEFGWNCNMTDAQSIMNLDK